MTRRLLGLRGQRPSIALLLGLLGCSTLACSSPDGRGELLGVSAEPIINGTASGASQDFVVLLIYDLGGGNFAECTGSLLAPNLVLTARHCVSTTPDQPFTCDANGTGSSGGDVTGELTPSQMYVFTGQNRPTTLTGAPAKGLKFFHDTATNVCNHDIALVGLTASIPNAAIASIRLDSKASDGESVTSVGWGATTATALPDTRQQRTGVSVANIGPYTGANGVDVPPNEFQVGESICQGDSGGPALDSMSNAIVGVVSRGGNGMMVDPNNPATGCVGGYNFYSQPSAFKDMIVEAYGEAGQAPWLEGQPDPRLAKFGAACTTSSDCQSSTCISNPKGNPYCTQDCSSNPCPGGYACKHDTGTALCEVTGGGTGTTTTSGGCSMGNGAPSSFVASAASVLAFVGLRKRRSRRRT